MNFASGRERYVEMAKEAGIKADSLRTIDEISEYEHGTAVDIDKVMYYRACVRGGTADTERVFWVQVQ